METTNQTPINALPEIEVCFKNKVKASERIQIRGSLSAYECFKKIFDADKIEWTEEFIMLCLNRNNRVLGWYRVSAGGIAGTVVDVKVIYTIALNCAASSIIIAHNHPSGNPQPSHDDLSLTRKIAEAGRILDIKLNDHLIMYEDRYTSFADEGLI